MSIAKKTTTKNTYIYSVCNSIKNNFRKLFSSCYMQEQKPDIIAYKNTKSPIEFAEKRKLDQFCGYMLCVMYHGYCLFQDK